VLAQSNERVQRWFEAARVPCVVLGTPHDEISLPSVALDIRSVCHHAAGEFLRLGHRRLGIVTPAHPSPGAVQALQGFVTTIRGRGDATVEVIEVADEALDAACRRVQRAVTDRRQLTGLLVINPLLYLAVQSTVQDAGLRVPSDVSLMTTYGDPFLRYVRPAPARYMHAPEVFARRLLKTVLQVGAGGVPAQRHVKVVPEYQPGASLAAVRTERVRGPRTGPPFMFGSDPRSRIQSASTSP
jgi:LacI family transcriptional regulator